MIKVSHKRSWTTLSDYNVKHSADQVVKRKKKKKCCNLVTLFSPRTTPRVHSAFRLRWLLFLHSFSKWFNFFNRSLQDGETPLTVCAFSGCLCDMRKCWQQRGRKTSNQGRMQQDKRIQPSKNWIYHSFLSVLSVYSCMFGDKAGVIPFAWPPEVICNTAGYQTSRVRGKWKHIWRKKRQNINGPWRRGHFAIKTKTEDSSFKQRM